MMKKMIRLPRVRELLLWNLFGARSRSDPGLKIFGSEIAILPEKICAQNIKQLFYYCRSKVWVCPRIRPALPLPQIFLPQNPPTTLPNSIHPLRKSFLNFFSLVEFFVARLAGSRLKPKKNSSRKKKFKKLFQAPNLRKIIRLDRLIW